MCKQIVVVQAETAEEFQKAFNDKLRELEYSDPQVEFHHGAGFCAYIIYSDNSQFVGIVEPENRCLCDSCMKCVEPPRRRVKWRKCALLGSVHGRDVCKHYMEVIS